MELRRGADPHGVHVRVRDDVHRVRRERRHVKLSRRRLREGRGLTDGKKQPAFRFNALPPCRSWVVAHGPRIKTKIRLKGQPVSAEQSNRGTRRTTVPNIYVQRFAFHAGLSCASHPSVRLVSTGSGKRLTGVTARRTFLFLETMERCIYSGWRVRFSVHRFVCCQPPSGVRACASHRRAR